ncbi:MAG: hypothetical protein C4342_00625 [Armatimonadota bacterium]
MKRKWPIGILAVVGLAVLAQGGQKPQVRFASLGGEGLKGSAVLVTLPGGEHWAFVQLEGLKPGSGSYVNRIHFNDAGDANCKAQNGNKIIPLTNLVAGADGKAVAYTLIPADKVAAYPKGTTYFNVHTNSPQAVGPSIACGDVSTVGD